MPLRCTSLCSSIRRVGCRTSVEASQLAGRKLLGATDGGQISELFLRGISVGRLPLHHQPAGDRTAGMMWSSLFWILDRFDSNLKHGYLYICVIIDAYN